MGEKKRAGSHQTAPCHLRRRVDFQEDNRQALVLLRIFAASDYSGRRGRGGGAETSNFYWLNSMKVPVVHIYLASKLYFRTAAAVSIFNLYIFQAVMARAECKTKKIFFVHARELLWEGP